MLPGPLSARSALPLERMAPPICPEIALWLLSHDVDLEAACVELAQGPPPFWAFCWAGGQALARYVLDHPEVVRGQRVVDFGAGCGVAGIAAARSGASCVVAVDCDPEALEAVQKNASENGVSIDVALRMPQDWDVLLAADVLYEAGNREWLLGELRSGRRLVIADPERTAQHRLGLTPQLHIDATTVPDVDPPVRRAAIFVLEA